MKKFTLSFCIILFISLFASAQKKDLIVKSSDKGLYLEHKVAPRESFFAIGRLYSVSPQFIASFNQLDIRKGLQIDQKLRIPLTDTNFAQQGNEGIPVYYRVKAKDGLIVISNKHNKVSLENLRSWNKLAKDEIKEDSKLIIGFLQSVSKTDNTIVKVEEKPVEKLEQKHVEKEEEKPVTKEEEKVPGKVEETPMGKEEEKPVEKTEENPVIKEEEKKPVVEEKPSEKVEEKPVEKPAEKTVTEEQGYFKAHFEHQVKTLPISKNETVTSSIFKTASGWKDGKYYLLIDKVAPGTIVRIINPSNNKAIYAKVLGEMSGIRQNEGLNIRISNAAASALQISEEDKFIVKMNY